MYFCLQNNEIAGNEKSLNSSVYQTFMYRQLAYVAEDTLDTYFGRSYR